MAKERKEAHGKGFDPDMAEWICEQIATTDMGIEPIVAKMKKEFGEQNTPSIRTVWYWISNNPDFAAQYEKAKEFQAELVSGRIVQEATTSRPETIVIEGRRGTETRTQDNTKRSDLIVRALNLRCEQLSPRRFGKLMKHEVAGKDGGPIDAAITVTFVKTGESGS